MVNLSLQSFKVPKQMANGTIYVWWFENFSQKYTSTLHQAKCLWQLLKCYFLQKYRLANKSHIELAIAKLLKKYIATSVEIEVFKTECLTFLITTTQKIFEHSHLASTIVRFARSLNPANLNHPSAPTLFKSLFSRLVYLKILQPKLGDTVLS